MFVCQTLVEKATEDGAARLCDWIDECLSEDAQQCRASGGIAILHDWRSVEAYETGARQVMLQRIRQRERGYARQTTVVVRASPIMKMGMQVANVTLAMFGNSSLRVCHEITSALPLLRGVVPGARPTWMK